MLTWACNLGFLSTRPKNLPRRHCLSPNGHHYKGKGAKGVSNQGQTRWMCNASLPFMLHSNRGTLASWSLAKISSLSLSLSFPAPHPIVYGLGTEIKSRNSHFSKSQASLKVIIPLSGPCFLPDQIYLHGFSFSQEIIRGDFLFLCK